MCQEKRIKQQQTVSSAGCKVLVPNAGFLLASMSSYCRFRQIECSYSQSVSLSDPQDKIRGSARQGKKVKLEHEAASDEAGGASITGQDDDVRELAAKQLEAAENALGNGHTAAQFEAAMKAVNPIGTIAAPLDVQLAHLQAVTIDHRTRAILMASKLHYEHKHLFSAAKKYRGALRWAAACDVALDAINGQEEYGLSSTAVASTRAATPSSCKLCSTSLSKNWQACSSSTGHAPQAGAASSAQPADGEGDDEVVVVGVTLAGERLKLKPAHNEADSAGKQIEDKVDDAGVSAAGEGA